MKPVLSFFLYALCTFAVAGSKPVAAQTANPNFYVADGGIFTSVLSGNTLYVGGFFSQVGPNIPNGAALSTATGLPNTAYAKPNAQVLTSVPDGSGGWYVGGEFTEIGTVPRNYLAHLLATGAVDMNWNPNPNHAVRTLLLNGTTLYAGGDFTTTGGQARYGLAALSTATGLATSWNPNVNGNITSLAGGDITLVVAGNFSTVNGQPRNSLASIFVSNGLPTGWNPNPDGSVVQVAVSGSTVYAVGYFNNIGGQERKYAAAIDNLGNATAFNANIGGDYADVLAVRNNTVYVGGYFGSAGGQSRFYFAALNAATGQATSWNPRPSGFVRSIAFSADGATMYVGGSFTQISDVPRKYVAAINTTTGAATSWSPNVSGGGIFSIAVSGNTAYIGGGFKTIGGVERNNLAAFDITTGLPTAWNPGANSFVAAMAKSGNTLYIGGGFGLVNGQDRTLLAGLDMTTGAVTPFSQTIYSLDVGDRVDAIAIGNNTLYIGGYFNNIGDFDERNRLAAFDITTGQLTSWNPNLDYGRIVGTTNIYAMAVAGNSVYVSGYALEYVGGQYRNGLVAFDATTGQLTPWAPLPSGGSPSGRVNALAVSPDASKVYVGGTFTNIGGQARFGLAALSTTTGQATAWNPNPNAGTNTLLISGNTVYVGGTFTNIGGQSHGNIAAVDAITGLVSSWNPNLSNSSINTMASAGGTVYVGGGGLRINNEPFGSLVAISNPAILPLRLTDFTANKQANMGALSWQVAQEENIATYTVERGTDGRSFTTMGSVASMGNTTTSRSYYFQDANPIKGANYYRLKITEKDGKVSYSEVRLLNFGEKISIALYPNPAKDKATLTGIEPGMQVRLVNVAGQVVVNQKATGSIISLPMSLLPAGRYQVQVLGTDGQPISNTSLVKE